MQRVVCITVASALMLAAGVSPAASQTQPNATERTHTATGVVKSVSLKSLTLENGGHEITFAMTPETRYIGRGGPSDLVLRTPEERLRRAIKLGDRVTVAYRPSGSAMNAILVRILPPQR